MFSIKTKSKKIKANTLADLINKLTRIGLKGKIIPKKGFKDNNYLCYIDLETQDKILKDLLFADQEAMNQALADEQSAQEEALAQFELEQQALMEEYHEAQIALEKEYNEMLSAAEEGLRELHKEKQAMLKAAKEMQEEEMSLLASLDKDVEFIFVPKKRK